MINILRKNMIPRLQEVWAFEFHQPNPIQPVFSILMAQIGLIELEKGVKPIWLAQKLGLFYFATLTFSNLLHLITSFAGVLMMMKDNCSRRVLEMDS